MDRDRPAGAAPKRHLRVVDDAAVQQAEAAAVDAARELALSLLTSRPRTAHELATALTRKAVDADVADRVVARLTEVGLIDDEAYARTYAEREAGRRGPRAIAEALKRRGIDPCLALEVAFAGDAEDVRATARAVAKAALPRWRGLPPEVVQRRLAGLLARRGYGQGLVYALVRELAAGDAAHDPADDVVDHAVDDTRDDTRDDTADDTADDIAVEPDAG